MVKPMPIVSSVPNIRPPGMSQKQYLLEKLKQKKILQQ